MTAQETVARRLEAEERRLQRRAAGRRPRAHRIGGDGDTVCSIVEWHMATPGAGPMTAAEVLEVRGGRVAVHAAPLALGYVERAGFRGGCRVKPSLKSRSALVGVRARGAVRHDLPTDCLRATDEMAVFGAHP
jgi:hypothetical protein